MHQQGYRPPVRQNQKTEKRNMASVSPNGFSPYDRRAPQQPIPKRTAQPPAGPVKKSKKRFGLGRGMFMMVMLCILTFGAFYLKVYIEVLPYEKVFAYNVYVDDIHLGGMTAQEGINAIRGHANNMADSLSIRLMAGDTLIQEINSQMLGITYDTDSALNNAWAVGHRGTIFDRKQELDVTRANPVKLYSGKMDANTQPVDDLLVQLKDYVYREPKNASFEFNANASEPFTFINEEPGMHLDIEPLRQQIYEKVTSMQGGDIQIEPTFTTPEVTVAMLKKKLSLRSRAVTSIDPKSEENRTNNIRRSFELLNGTILKPGEKFSFNNVVGWRTEERGFFTALEYAYGELVPGVGGGVCQASTNVYLAAVEAGMEILNREPHSGSVSYTELGKDATVFMSKDRKIDFVFRNNTEENIYITAAVKKDPSNSKRLITEVSIYGLSLDNVSYKLEAKEVEVIPKPEEVIIKDKKQEYVTYVDERYVKDKGREGHVIETYLVKLVDGREVERTTVDKDTYKARAPQVYVGIQER